MKHDRFPVLVVLIALSGFGSDATSADGQAAPKKTGYVVTLPITPDNVKIPDGSADELERFLSPGFLNQIMRENNLGPDDCTRFLAIVKSRTAEKIFADPKASYRQKSALRQQAVQAVYNLVRLDAKQYRPMFDSYVEHVVKTDPKSTAAYFGRAQQFLFDSNLAGGVPVEDLSDKALAFAKANPENPNTKVFLDRVARQVDKTKPEEALKCYKTALKLFPNDMLAPKWQGSICRLELPGKPMPLSGPTLDGTDFNIDSLKGKVVLVHFWATFSGQSSRELPRIKAAYDKLHARGFEIVGISLDRHRETVERFVREKQLPWKQIFFKDYRETGWENPIVKKYAVAQVPAMFLVGKDGKVAIGIVLGESGLEAPVEAELAK